MMDDSEFLRARLSRSRPEPDVFGGSAKISIGSGRRRRSDCSLDGRSLRPPFSGRGAGRRLE